MSNELPTDKKVEETENGKQRREIREIMGYNTPDWIVTKVQECIDKALAEEKERYEKEQAEFAIWCYKNGWVFNPRSSDEWLLYINGNKWFKTTQELLTEYRNQNKVN